MLVHAILRVAHWGSELPFEPSLTMEDLFLTQFKSILDLLNLLCVGSFCNVVLHDWWHYLTVACLTPHHAQLSRQDSIEFYFGLLKSKTGFGTSTHACAILAAHLIHLQQSKDLPPAT
jgi:hypothetical protein